MYLDTVIRKPAPPVISPAGWTKLGEFTWSDENGDEHQNSVFWKIIGDPYSEMPPTFTAEDAEEWEIHGSALTGLYLRQGENDDAGSAV